MGDTDDEEEGMAMAMASTVNNNNPGNNDNNNSHDPNNTAAVAFAVSHDNKEEEVGTDDEEEEMLLASTVNSHDPWETTNANIQSVSPNNAVTGSSKDMKFRQGKYRKKGHSPRSFKVNFDLDMIDDQTNTAFLELYEEAKEALLACEELPSHQKHWFRQMFEKHGDLLGPKVTFVLQSIESAYQAFT